MGDPKFPDRKYDTPSHPWEEDRIAGENDIVNKYGLKNKREVWRTQSKLRNIRRQARDLLAVATRDPQARKERDELIEHLARIGVLDDEDASLDDVLALGMDALLQRRLQTQVYRKGLANTPEQARQLIVHGHISVGGQRVTIPSYIVTRQEEPTLDYAPSSPISDPLHPARPDVEEGETAGPTSEEE